MFYLSAVHCLLYILFYNFLIIDKKLLTHLAVFIHLRFYLSLLAKSSYKNILLYLYIYCFYCLPFLTLCSLISFCFEKSPHYHVITFGLLNAFTICGYFATIGRNLRCCFFNQSQYFAIM